MPSDLLSVRLDSRARAAIARLELRLGCSPSEAARILLNLGDERALTVDELVWSGYQQGVERGRRDFIEAILEATQDTVNELEARK